jgi:hypothetical protein
MAQYKLYTGGPYKQNNGTAITSTSTDITVGAAKLVKDSDILNRTENSTQEQGVPTVKGGVDGVFPGDVQNGVVVDSFTASSEGLLQCVYGSAHGLVVGDMVIFTDVQFPKQAYRVVRVVSGTELVINELPTSDLTVLNTISTFKLEGTFSTQGAENFVMQKNDAQVHGIVASVALAGASDFGRSKMHKTNAVRTRKVATAIREGKYDFVSGEFDSGYPTEANDFGGMDTDGSNVPDDESKSAAGKREVGGELTFKSGGTPTTSEYPAKTT